MNNKELFDRATYEGNFKLQEKLRNDFQEWCKKNGKKPHAQSVQEWFKEVAVMSHNETF